MNRIQRALLLAGGVLFLLALFLPCVDDDYGEFASGRKIRGYQCFVGLFLMPLVVPLATPLWVVLLAGNLWAITASCTAAFRRTLHPFLRRTRWLALFSVAALLVLTILRRPLGLTAIHAGYAAWVASLVLVCAGAWLPRDTE